MTDIAKKLICVLFLLSVLCIVVGVGVSLYMGWRFIPFVSGVTLGAAVNALNILLLDKAVGKVADGTITHQGIIQLCYFARFIMMAVALTLSVLLPDYIGIAGVAAAIFTKPIATYSLAFITKQPDIELDKPE
jgi:hypothetical protein